MKWGLRNGQTGRASGGAADCAVGRTHLCSGLGGLRSGRLAQWIGRSVERPEGPAQLSNAPAEWFSGPAEWFRVPIESSRLLLESWRFLVESSRGLLESWRGLLESWRGLLDSWRGLLHAWRGLRRSWAGVEWLFYSGNITGVHRGPVATMAHHHCQSPWNPG